MGEDQPLKKHLPRWAKRTLLVISIVGPLTGAVVTLVSGYYDIKAKASSAKTQTKASYETLAPAVKELQDLLAKTQDVVDADEKEIAALKAVRDEQEKRLIRLEAYIELLGRRGNNPAPPPEVATPPRPIVATSKVKKLRPAKPVLPDVNSAKQFQDVKAELRCKPDDPQCDYKAAAAAAPQAQMPPAASM